MSKKEEAWCKFVGIQLLEYMSCIRLTELSLQRLVLVLGVPYSALLLSISSYVDCFCFTYYSSSRKTLLTTL